METSGDSTEHTDVLELVKDTWAELGIELLIRPSQLEVFRRRVFSGEAMMSATRGTSVRAPDARHEPGLARPGAASSSSSGPSGAPASRARGRAARRPRCPRRATCVDLYQRWLESTDPDERARIWAEMLDINAEEVFTIGIVGGTLQPVVVKNGLRGVPAKGVYSWEPGSHFGVHGPDTFYWQNGRR